jgi:YfiH family protein
MLTFENLTSAGIYHGITDSSYPYVPKEDGLPKDLTEGYQPIQMEQIHNNLSMILIEGEDEKMIEGADALVSNVSKQLLIIRTADCAPILMYDPDKKIVAAIHAGRKSITWGIIKQVIESFKILGSNPENILVGIGPHIRTKNYEIKEDVVEQIGDSAYKEFVRYQDDKTYFDLTEAVFSDLVEEGVLLHNIEDCGIDTYEEYEKYFSHRKWSQDQDLYGGEDRRFGSFIAL